jgi:hypothetical protein
MNTTFARLQLQVRLREIEQTLGWDEMLSVLASAVESEFRRHDLESRVNTACSNQLEDSFRTDNPTLISQ